MILRVIMENGDESIYRNVAQLEASQFSYWVAKDDRWHTTNICSGKIKRLECHDDVEELVWART